METDITRRTVSSSDGVSAAEVQQQLERILSSAGFSTSERHSRLLRYLVTRALEGRGEEIKEYALGVDIFGRGSSFDPQSDAIVRTEISRLRARLKTYYTGAGSHDRIVIELPKRTYVPVFCLIDTAGTGPLPDAAIRHWLWTFSAALLTVALVTIYVVYSQGRAAAARAGASGNLNALAVLPFVNSDRDPEMERFADGLTEEVIETLAEIDGLRVVSSTSAFQFKGKTEDLRTVAAKLRVGAILEGAVHRSGQRVRITAHLVDAAAGHQYYSHTYDHPLNDAIAVQREIAAHVAAVLRVHEDGREVSRFTNNPEAYRAYLQALDHASRLNEPSLREAVASYQEAIGHDPNYSPAYTGLSEAYILLSLLNEAPSRSTMQRAAEAARAAVRSGDSFAHAHAALGSIKALYEWDWPGAEKEFRKAIEADPNDSNILQQYAMRFLAPQGSLDSALFQLQAAQQVDPFNPQVRLTRGRLLSFKRDSGRALRTLQEALELDPHLETAPLALAETYLQSGAFDQALKALLDASGPTEDEARLAALGSVYGFSHQTGHAREILRELLRLSRNQDVSGFYLAQVHLSLGDTQSALSALERAADERSPLIVFAGIAPQFESLHAEPRFIALLKRLGLEH